MSPRKRWLLVSALVVGAALAYSHYRERGLGCFVENFRRYSAPNATVYDAVTAPLLGGFFGRVATELAAFAPRGQVLKVGSGPGRLAVKLAELAPGAQVRGVDISPEMVERAISLAANAGVADCVEFRVGDVASLPFADASFDAVVSTFSLHHWPDPAKSLEEIYRVLRPGGVVRIYDVVDWIRRFEKGGESIAELAEESPFGEYEPTATASLPGWARSHSSTGPNYSGSNSSPAQLAKAMADLHWCLRRLEKTPTFAEVAFSWKVAAH